MSGDPLDASSPAVVIVEDPPWFEYVIRAWESGQISIAGVLAPEECVRPGDIERSEEQRLGFGRYIRDAGHQADLENAAQRPVITVTTGPQPAVRPSGAIRATRAAKQMLEGGPPPAVAAATAEEGHHEDAAADRPGAASPGARGGGLSLLPWTQTPGTPPS